FADRKADEQLLEVPENMDPAKLPDVDWPYFEKHLTTKELNVFKAFSRVIYYQPQKPWRDFLSGFEWDVQKREIKNIDDLFEYTDHVSTAPFTAAVVLLLYKLGEKIQ